MEAAVVAAMVTAAAGAAVRLARNRQGALRSASRWTRVNHAGRPVSLLEGPAVVLGAVAGTVAPVLAPAVGAARLTAMAGRSGGWPAAAATAAAGALGALDDHLGDGSPSRAPSTDAATPPTGPSKGLRGHLTALRSGRVTTGAVKVVGLVVAGGIAAYGARETTTVMGLGTMRTMRTLRTLQTTATASAHEVVGGTPYGGGGGVRDASGGRAVAALQLAVDAGVVAGSANLVNLLDLRPGRAIKATVLLAVPLALGGSVPAAAAVGAAVAALPDDLAGRSMLGDTGANALGALVGTAAVGRLPPWARMGVLGALTALTLASERVSFTAVIARTPVLRELDAWGRR